MSNGDSHAGLRFIGGGAQVRCADDVFQSDQIHVVSRFFFKDIDSCARNFFGLQGIAQGFFLDNSTTGTVNQEYAIFHFGK